MKLLLNCDLGEWESPSTAEAFIDQVDLINIACGGHAGSAEQIAHCKKYAEKAGVQAGAHPGTAGQKGRGTTEISVSDFNALLQEQVGFYRQHAGEPGHLKLHGSLYHLSESQPELCQNYLNFCEEHRYPIIALARGAVVTAAKERGLPYLEEAFLDRRTLANGQLVPRSEPHAIIKDLGEIVTQIPTIEADTACIHSDSPAGLEMAQAARKALT